MASNVLSIPGGYGALICAEKPDEDGNLASGQLLTAVSYDGSVWTADDLPQPVPSANGRDNAIIYRAAVPASGNSYDAWYSAKSAGGAWRIGRTARPLPIPPRARLAFRLVIS